MGKAGKYNIVIEEGSTFGLDLLYKDSSGNRQNLSSLIYWKNADQRFSWWRFNR